MSAVLAIICSILIVVADQLTKYLVITQMAQNEVIEVIPGILNFNRIIPNSGAAFGIFAGKTWFLITVTCIIMVICICMLIRKTFQSKLMFWALCLVLAGGVGNMIDRVFRGGNVIDFLEFGFFDFPVFNVADCAVCIGAVMIVIYFFVDFIKDSRKKNNIAGINAELENDSLQEKPKRRSSTQSGSEQKNAQENISKSENTEPNAGNTDNDD